MTRFTNSFEGPLIVYIGGKPKWVSKEEYIKLCGDGITDDQLISEICDEDTHAEWRQINDETE